MRNKTNKILGLFLILSLLITLTSCINIQINDSNEPNNIETEESINKDGHYLDLESVAEYIKEYEKLPSNFLTKKQAQDLGWIAKDGNLWDVAPNHAIGGDKFGNREGLLPKEKGRVYYECDVNYSGGRRGPERIVFSNDGLIYYTKDHYKSFTKLFGDE
ncbi:MAG TPA: ribonuclease domain-containing protein [Tissierellaceae bacterium]